MYQYPFQSHLFFFLNFFDALFYFLKIFVLKRNFSKVFFARKHSENLKSHINPNGKIKCYWCNEKLTQHLFHKVLEKCCWSIISNRCRCAQKILRFSYCNLISLERFRFPFIYFSDNFDKNSGNFNFLSSYFEWGVYSNHLSFYHLH